MDFETKKLYEILSSKYLHPVRCPCSETLISIPCDDSTISSEEPCGPVICVAKESIKPEIEVEDMILKATTPSDNLLADIERIRCRRFQPHPIYVPTKPLFVDITKEEIKPTPELVCTCKCPPSPTALKVAALDCRNIKIDDGIEVTKVTLVDSKLNHIYSEICEVNKIYNQVSNANRFIKNLHQLHSCKTLIDVQKELLMFITEETILIGHKIEEDLKMLNIIHLKVIDASTFGNEIQVLPCCPDKSDIILYERIRFKGLCASDRDKNISKFKADQIMRYLRYRYLGHF